MMWLCIVISALVAALATVGVGIYWFLIGLPSLGLLIPMLYLTVLLTGISNALIAQQLRRDTFRQASMGIVVRTAVTVCTQLVWALAWPSATGLIVGFALGLVAQVALGLLQMRRHHRLGGPPVREMRAMFRRFRRQVSIDIPSTLIAAMSLNLMPFLLQLLFGIRIVGFYLLGHRIAVVPLQLFNDSFSRVFFQRAARSQDERGEFWREFKMTLVASGAISLVMLVGLELLARPVVHIYLGPDWDMAATILIVLAPMLALRSVAMSLATTVFVLNRPGWLFIHNIASISAIGLAFAAAWFWSLGLIRFLELVAVLQGIEYIAFVWALGSAAWRRQRSVASRACAQP